MELTKDDLEELGQGSLVDCLEAMRAGKATMHVSSGDTIPLPSRVTAFLAEALELALIGGVLLVGCEATMTPNEAAAVLGVSRPTIYKWINEGLLEDRPVGVDHRIPVSSVEAMVQRRQSAERRAAALVRQDPGSARVRAARERVAARRAQQGV